MTGLALKLSALSHPLKVLTKPISSLEDVAEVSYIRVNYVLHRLLLNFAPFITVGETLAVMCLAKDKNQARIVLRYVTAILNHVRALQSMIVDQRIDEIELTKSVTIMVKASDFGGVHGPSYSRILFFLDR